MGGKEKLWELGAGAAGGGSAPPSWNINPKASWGREVGIVPPLHLGEGFETQPAAGYKEILSGNPSPFLGERAKKNTGTRYTHPGGKLQGRLQRSECSVSRGPWAACPRTGTLLCSPSSGNALGPRMELGNSWNRWNTGLAQPPGSWRAEKGFKILKKGEKKSLFGAAGYSGASLPSASAALKREMFF